MRRDVLDELRGENPVPEVPPPPPFGPLLARLDERPLIDGRQRPKPRWRWGRAVTLGPALVAAAVAIAVAVGALALLGAARKPLTPGVTPSPAAPSRVRVWIANANNGQDVSNGGVSGRGHFKASGAISDTGAVVTYRRVKGELITLRYVTTSAKGAITYVVRINVGTGTSRWTITSATGRYKGLHGRGAESENPPYYTISILTGTIWR